MITCDIDYKKLNLKLKSLYLAHQDIYKYFWAQGYWSAITEKEDDWAGDRFVSVDKEGAMLGYFAYDLDRRKDSIGEIMVMSFEAHEPERSVEFARDFAFFLKNLVCRYRKITFTVVCGNPIEKTYDRICTENGGQIVGVQKEHVKLADGKYYDYKTYEIFKQ